MKLGMYAYYIISMTITCFHDDRIMFVEAIFFKTTLLLKLANCSTHGGETWYTCIIHRFHDNHNNKIIASVTKLLLHFSNLLTVARMEVKHGTHVYYIVSMMTTTTKASGTFLYYYFFTPQTR